MDPNTVNPDPDAVNRLRMESVYRRSLAQDARRWLADDPTDVFAAQAVATTETIAADLVAERDRLAAVAARRGVLSLIHI